MPPKTPPKPIAAEALPYHWYLFFGILEPLSVLAGAVYAILLPERYNHELIPPAFFPASTLQNSLRQAGVLTDATRMALGQLGSCYLLIMLNSALMFYALRRYVRDQQTLETLIRWLIVVLGVADWTHIGLTIALLPNGPPKRSGLVGMHKAGTLDKFVLLAQPGSWNSLLFGNILITFGLFCARVAWWTGIARGPVGHAKTA
ncbi:hypothetical protein PSEUBRA_000224 [Kalmanozyma brasiliensis GHG001]|uniref:DUF7704 domain-containing protein n=1 Tax=Kalmanozyma brasiliensis (strain GHG001) TaxID=1365824 RepID=V5EW97_KALBG|nr:uncharacterized protein PSEUBRA_000224 [Kalmanozyma brasiliensis GHG001]EST09835.1 hypothetical protein PSEUBRA_000224 [Kalmanozyma brasiliensis GHG001]